MKLEYNSSDEYLFRLWKATILVKRTTRPVLDQVSVLPDRCRDISELSVIADLQQSGRT